MKRVLTSFVFVALILAPCRAVTVENPADWDFLFQVSLGNSWSSDTQVPTGAEQYDFTWEFNLAELQIENDVWFSILDLLEESTKSGSGSASKLALDIPSTAATPFHIEVDGIIADIYLAVLQDGQGVGQIYPTLGTVTGGGEPPVQLDITDAKFGGKITVNAVPEPATIALLTFGGLFLLKKRRV